MTLVELAAFFLDAWPLQEVLESNFEGDVGGALDFFSADSDFYPDLDRLLRERTCAFFPGRKGGDACPFCEHFNVPPAADVCEHAVAWVWDGQAEALGGGRAFAQALTDLRDAILAAGETSTAASILAALGEFDPVRADLLEAATGGLQQALELTAQAQAGDGWSTEGMLSGSGHSICIPEPDALEALVGHCRALVAASALEVQTQGRGGQVDLESLRPATAPSWCLAASGFWSQDVYHGGHVAYFLAQVAPGTWLLDRVVRNAILDDVTQEDVDEGRLNDDQIQAMWGSTLDEAQSFEHRQIVAACTGAAAELSNTDIAAILYRPACDADCQEIDEPDSRKGLLAL